MIVRYLTALTVMFGLHFPTLAQAPRRDGNWEITMAIEMDGVPSQLPPRTTTQCVTKEEAADPKKAITNDGGIAPGGCSASDHKVDGNRVTWAFKCETPKAISGTGEINYTDENSYTGLIKFLSDGKTMTMKYSGKRLGDCTK